MRPAFKIEKLLNQNNQQPSDPDQRHQEIMNSLNQLHEKLSNNQPPIPVQNPLGDDPLLQSEINEKQQELARMKDEMRAIYLAIDDTKKQILTIKENGSEGREISRAAEELSAIVKGTEDATNNILQAAEVIDTNSSNLIASLQDESQQAVACEIHESIVNIFEACNFQDVTGQRITKVVKTFCFIEQRIEKMMDIWGGVDAFLDVTPEELDSRQGDKGLLNGPSLDNDVDVASQADIDALFD